MLSGMSIQALDASQYRRESDGKSWSIETMSGCSFGIADENGAPHEDSVVLVRAVAEELVDLERRALGFMKQHLGFPHDQYDFSKVIEILPKPDRYGVRIVLSFYNYVDGYLSIDVGVRQCDLRKGTSRIHYALVTYN